MHQGIGRKRQTERFNRARSRLRRLIVLGHTGFITLEALRWIRDAGASFAQIDQDPTVIAVTTQERVSTAKDLRRAQVLAAESDLGRQALIELLQSKLEAQARFAESLLRYPTVGARKQEETADGTRRNPGTERRDA